MENKIYNTKELYGVFCNDGTFQIGYDINVDECVHCLFQYELPINTLMQEEIGLYNPLAVYNPYEPDKKKTIYWPDGRFFIKDGKYYKAVRLDILLNEYLLIKSNWIKSQTVERFKKVINKKIKSERIISENIWENMTISYTSIARFDNEFSYSEMNKSILADFNRIKAKDGIDILYMLNRKMIEKRVNKSNNSIIYIDRLTREIVRDRFDRNGNLLNRLYYNPRSQAILQVYFQDQNEYYLCGIKKEEPIVQELFDDKSISSKTHTTRPCKKLQKIKSVEP